MTKGLFIYHRDFRTTDNTGLIRASKKCDTLYICFVFTPEQVTKNTYKSKNSVQFMIESLMDLEKNVNKKLIIIYDHLMDALKNLMDVLGIDRVFFNKDYTPYAIERSKKVQALCDKETIICEQLQDYYIQTPGAILNGKGTPYVRFSSFYQSYLKQPEHIFRKPSSYTITNISAIHNKRIRNTISLKDAMNRFVGDLNKTIAVRGGREKGISVLSGATKQLINYTDSRNTLNEQTSMLSAYIKYGCVSIREVVHAFQKRYSIEHSLIRQFIWRDFYMHLLYTHPHTLYTLPNTKMNKAKWIKNGRYLRKWKEGNTGFPIVDAGMRQMNETGYMHNRARMVTASLLSKILYINWKEGETYFAQTLVDYDVASNSGNWQAVVGGGLYSMPWFRVFSPWAQSVKHDKDTSYIKRWVPELKHVPSKHIHRWYDYHTKYKQTIAYPPPIVNYNEKRKEYMSNMKRLLS